MTTYAKLERLWNIHYTLGVNFIQLLKLTTPPNKWILSIPSSLFFLPQDYFLPFVTLLCSNVRLSF